MSQDYSKILDAISFNADGLVPAIAQDVDKNDVLMMAWMNRDAVIETLSTGKVCYWTRSRQKLWRKGETSGQQQELVDFLVDCDGDTILVKVRQKGVACHTGRRSCFYLSAGKGDRTDLATIMEPEISPEELYGKKS